MNKFDPATYAIEEVETGKMYVGSTQDVNLRQQQHMSKLRHGKHVNRGLQEAYDRGSELNFIVERKSTIEEAIQREQEVLDSHFASENNLLFNRATDARNPYVGWERPPISEQHKNAISRANSGKIYSEEEKLQRRQNNPLVKPVVIDGVEHISISEAGRALNLKKGTVQYRVDSPTDKFSGWKYKEEN